LMIKSLLPAKMVIATFNHRWFPKIFMFDKNTGNNLEIGFGHFEGRLAKSN
jgi:hypothetical protein